MSVYYPIDNTEREATTKCARSLQKYDINRFVKLGEKKSTENSTEKIRRFVDLANQISTRKRRSSEEKV